jgi:tRNA (guanine-N7-)-methyltransferase
MSMEPPPGKRPIRSYVLRGGRMTPSQRSANAVHWVDYGLERENGVLDPASAYPRPGPLVLEIGFGMGGSLALMAAAEPDTNFLGVEVHAAGVGRLMANLVRDQRDNVRVYRDDAVQVLSACISDGALDGVQIYFPDPWHKKRHYKRRLIQPDFIQLLRCKLRPGGWLHLATDWENYAEHMLEVLDAAPGFTNPQGLGQYYPRPQRRPLTKFEARGQRLGHGVWDLFYSRD